MAGAVEVGLEVVAGSVAGVVTEFVVSEVVAAFSVVVESAAFVGICDVVAG